jgi:metallophosphoesterase superfamily enzyme
MINEIDWFYIAISREPAMSSQKKSPFVASGTPRTKSAQKSQSNSVRSNSVRSNSVQSSPRSRSDSPLQRNTPRKSPFVDRQSNYEISEDFSEGYTGFDAFPGQLPARESSQLNFLVIGDPHFKTSNVIEMKEMSDAIVAVVESRKPDFVVCLGDVLDTHSKIDQVPERMATEWLFRISQLCRIFLIVGNHDRMSDEDFLTTQHPFTAHKKWQNFDVIDQGRVIEFGGHRIVMVPYVYRGRLDEALDVIRERDCPDEAGVESMLASASVVFTHQEFRNSKMGAIVSRHGDIWPNNRPLAINGHIHEYAWMQENLVCVGTPCQHSHADGRDKSISMFTIVQDASTQFHKILVHEERIDLGLRKYVRIKTSAAEFLDTTPSVDPSMCTFSWVVTGTRAELAHLKRFPKWAEWKPWIIEQISRDPPVLLPLLVEKRVSASSSTVFLESLAEQAGGDSRLEYVFNKIFAN